MVKKHEDFCHLMSMVEVCVIHKSYKTSENTVHIFQNCPVGWIGALLWGHSWSRSLMFDTPVLKERIFL